MDERISSIIADSSPTEIAEGLPPLANQSALPLRDIRAAEPTFMEVFLAWEKLRILYNGLLIVAVLGIILKSGFNLLAGIFFVEPAIYANVGFCAGPVAEGYLSWLGFRHPACRWFIFALGLFITLVLAIEYTQDLLRRFDR
jgi:hypothetical protein